MESFEMSSRWRINVTINEEMDKQLESWAKREKRSVSNLASAILAQALREYEKGEFQWKNDNEDTV